jgi:hypothetical protein
MCPVMTPDRFARDLGHDGASMATQQDEARVPSPVGAFTVDAVVRIGLLGLLLYWTWRVVGPFVTVALWSAILTVALYPLFDWLARRLGSRRLAATLITLLCLMIVIGPVTWLGFGLIGSAEYVVRDESNLFSIPLPPEKAGRSSASRRISCGRSPPRT